MPWFYVDDAFADSKPVMQLDRSLRNEAIGLWVRCGAWTAKEETDGHVPLDTVKYLGGTPRLIKALHDQAGLWVESSPESWRNSREIVFGNWEKWQKTKAETQAKRKADAARQATHRRTKKGRGYVADDVAASDDTETSRRDTDHGAEEPDPDDSKYVSRRESRDPDPTRPDPTLIPIETLGGGVALGDAREPRPQCPQHEENSPTPCPACLRRRRWDEARETEQADDELDERRRARELRDRCAICKGTNWIPDTDPAVKCDHQAAM